MNNLAKINEKLIDELSYLKEDGPEDGMNDNEVKSNKSKSYEYLSTNRKTKGKAMYITYEVDYDDLNNYLKDKVKGISWTLPKTRATFKAIRKYIGFEGSNKE